MAKYENSSHCTDTLIYTTILFPWFYIKEPY